MEKKENFEITSDLKRMIDVRNFVKSFCKKTDNTTLDDNRIDLIELAVHEAVVNIIKHAYRKKTEEPIQINAVFFDTSLIFYIYDQGESFNPETVPLPDFEGSKDGGFGVYIIAQSFDEVSYTRDKNGKNCVCLKINLTGEK